MQSAVPHVLRTLERTHDPANVERAVQAARAAGLQVSLDLIYGTPGESLDDWRTSLAAATSLAPDHVSAYALVVEDGTKLAAQVRRGQVPAPEDDDEAAKYEIADEHLAAAGYGWYEVSNWALRDDARCRHNEGYWADGNWWGIGPGAHSHVGGVRWWNVKHPNAYASRLGDGLSPAHGRETLTDEQRYDERVLLTVRMVDGLPDRRPARRGPGRRRRADRRRARGRDSGPAPSAGGADETGPAAHGHRRATAPRPALRATSPGDDFTRRLLHQLRRHRVAVPLAVVGLDRRHDRQDDPGDPGGDEERDPDQHDRPAARRPRGRS